MWVTKAEEKLAVELPVELRREVSEQRAFSEKGHSTV